MSMLIPALSGTRKGENVNGKQGRPTWTGIIPTPKVFEQLDYEETSVLALLAWSVASNRPVTASDVASLPDRNGEPLGRAEAKVITQRLTDLGILSVLGMHNDRALGIFVGGFQPLAALKASQHAAGRSAFSPGGRPEFSSSTPAQRSHIAPPPRARHSQSTPGSPAYTSTRPGKPTERRSGPPPFPRERRIERDLGATTRTPTWVIEEAHKLRDRQTELESGTTELPLVKAAEERLNILKSRIDLYQRWLRAEPSHPTLRPVLRRKRAALPELRYQLERARMPGGSKREQKRKAEGRDGK